MARLGECCTSAHRGRVSPIERWDSCPHAWRTGDRLPRRHLPVREGAAGWLLPADGNGRGLTLFIASKQTNCFVLRSQNPRKRKKEKKPHENLPVLAVGRLIRTTPTAQRQSARHAVARPYPPPKTAGSKAGPALGHQPDWARHCLVYK